MMGAVAAYYVDLQLRLLDRNGRPVPLMLPSRISYRAMADGEHFLPRLPIADHITFRHTVVSTDPAGHAARIEIAEALAERLRPLLDRIVHASDLDAQCMRDIGVAVEARLGGTWEQAQASCRLAEGADVVGARAPAARMLLGKVCRLIAERVELQRY